MVLFTYSYLGYNKILISNQTVNPIVRIFSNLIFHTERKSCFKTFDYILLKKNGILQRQI